MQASFGHLLAPFVLFAYLWVQPSPIAAECQLVFAAELVRDTILPSEHLQVSLCLTNRGEEPSYYRHIWFTDTFVNIHLTRAEDGWEVDYSGGQAEWILDTTLLDKINPGDTVQAFHEIPSRSTIEMEIVCESPRRGWRRWQTGTYVAELRYMYDWWGRNTCGESAYLRDTVYFVVRPEGPADREAFAALLTAYCLPDRQWVSAFWDVMQDHRSSAYRRLAAYYIAASLHQGKHLPLPRGVTVSEVIRAFAREDPFDEAVASAVERLLNGIGKCRRTALRDELLNSLPRPSTMRTILEDRRRKKTHAR